MNKKQTEFFESIYIKTYRMMLGVAISRLNDVGGAEDAVHDAYVIATNKIDALMESTNPEGWLVKTLNYLIMHEYRTRTRLLKMFTSYESLLDENRLSAEDERLFELHSLFTEDEWTMLTRVYLDGLSLVELADEMSIGYDTCRRRLIKIKEMAREKLSKK